MDIYSTEEQQVESIKKWIKENGKSVLWSVALAATIILGYRYWEHHTSVVAENASATYNAMVASFDKRDNTSASSKANKLIEMYPKTPYASLASLNLAKIAVEEQNLEGSIPHLNWVIDNTKIEDFRIIAQIRLAKVQFALGKQQESLKSLENMDADGYQTLVDELKGDIYISQNDTDKAHESYKAALKATPSTEKGDLQRPFLQMKLNDTGYENDNE